jgi:undecaprenyl-diphosphatase
MGDVFEFIQKLDVSIYYYLSHFADNWILARLAGLEESNNLIKGGLFFALYWYLWFRPAAHQEKRRKAIVAIPVAAVIAIIIARFIAFIAPFRLRPMNDPALVHATFPIAMHYNLEQWSSFPSDTAAYFFVLAFGIAYVSRRLAIPIMVYTAVWVGLGRMYLGIHYTSDMIAGAAIGIAVAWLSLRNQFLRSLAAQPVLTADQKPQLFYPVAFLVSFEMASVFAGLRDLGNRFIHFFGIALHAGFLRTGSTRSVHPIDTWGGLVALAAFAAVAVWVIHASSGSGRKIMGFLGDFFGPYAHSRHAKRR